MLGKFISKIVGSKNERELKRMQPLVEAINALEPSMEAKSDAELAALTPAFRERLAAGETLDDLLPEAFAAVREAGRRTIGQRHYDAQIIGGIVLHEGKIAEMKTGEGKTLAATLPVYLNAITGRGVHVVTVNDYLAKRDAKWMGQIYTFMGLTVGCIVHGLDDDERTEAYGADVTYGTNNEFGFDYLRDNMKFDLAELCQRDFYFAIVDEVDSILIDEARTPLIISGPAEKSTQLYVQMDRLIPRLQKETHFTVDEKSRTASLTDEGVNRCEQMLKVDNLYDPRYMELVHHLNQALKAYSLFKRDVDYIVQDGEVVIVDEFTGRLMPGRRYSEGLHQALEAKEKIKVKSENQTLATITFQNYFRMYDKLAGMTGTADTEAEEFHKIYELEVMVIPTHREMVRKDHADSVYRTEDEKYQAAVDEIKELHGKGQPVLVGTVSVEKSEMLAAKLKRLGVPHTVLNAKHHAKEAEIVAQAGRKGAVTISTNMAGRGTDIVLGGNPEAMAFKDADPEEDPDGFEQALAKYTELCATERDQVTAAGGLHILGTERHESRRIDNQLRGRSGRQGDPGSSRFYLSLEDELLRLFGSDRIKGIMGKLGMEEGEPIEHNMISKAIENAQRKVEGRNFQIRKQLLEYDDVLNKQREVIYAQRRMAMTGEGVHDSILEMFEELAEEVVLSHADDSTPAGEWDMKAIKDAVKNAFGFAPQISDVEQYDAEGLAGEVGRQALELYAVKEKNYGSETMRQLERWILLDRVDSLWKDHLLNMDHLKEGIGLRGYGQKDPLREYQREGFEMFSDMVERVKHETVGTLMRVQIASEEDVQAMAPEEEIPMSFSGGEETQPETVQRKGKKVGRNDPCPCGSGKKYKKCCGRA
ncbi:MAG: preprotein translocase subunit SecA [Desulfarculaceae bacterium]|nr:preprotein translocase subunit SecA [Desulfarculaceae bacterium]MCF8071015.1 preprotein translocase subunit SecA [Desulfarculaceae bacterium]MCF8100603.1 preprotein translocase subunit SecA [Desulfarculaceae bacterium]MCF8116963.1 preprotein translocase subunit SecA [Desulfarculaceae bacterium]